MKLELVVIPVSDVDRARDFYRRLGWKQDSDFRFDNGFRVIQFTPPGSGTSIQFGIKVTPVAPGSAQSLYLVVSGEHEKRIGRHDTNWPDWHATYMVAEQAGQELPQ